MFHLNHHKNSWSWIPRRSDKPLKNDGLKLPKNSENPSHILVNHEKSWKTKKKSLIASDSENFKSKSFKQKQISISNSLIHMICFQPNHPNHPFPQPQAHPISNPILATESVKTARGVPTIDPLPLEPGVVGRPSERPEVLGWK